MNRFARLLAVAAVCAGCGSVPPAPVDHFYRMQAVNVAPVAGAQIGVVAVQPFRADSLYAERPVVYAEEASLRQLRQYHYHLWLYPPAQMAHDHLVASLGHALDLSGGSNAPNVLEGRVLGFERVLSGKSSKAAVALELRLMVGGQTRLSKTYRAEQPAVDESLDAFTVAMEHALGTIYAEFLADVASGR